ncbi:unnamed protein product [Tetraodon nigroviridis]|uniref:Chromosome 18 SCAF15038, whole genome shotgun sequence n=1 Tax=Tetraodon nigroviridis TaxID=99883 RepID=Q4RJC8_TETNG|nr:unnamed protein product [Tetraodon nigroviridis]
MSLQGLDDTEAATVVKHLGGVAGRPVVSPKYCPGVNNNPGYLCETGHCCGETGCCTYYYELWWFWLLWTVLILFSCFCAYRHRRAKLRIQQQQRQREINLIAYNGACNYPSSTLDLSFLASFKLPSYEEVTDETYGSSRVSTPGEAAGECPAVTALRATSPPSRAPPDVIPTLAPDVIPSQRRWSNGPPGGAVSGAASLPSLALSAPAPFSPSAVPPHASFVPPSR